MQITASLMADHILHQVSDRRCRRGGGAGIGALRKQEAKD